MKPSDYDGRGYDPPYNEQAQMGTTTSNAMWLAILDLQTRVSMLESVAEKPKPASRKRKTILEKLEPYPTEVREMVQRLIDVWPCSRRDGSIVKNDVVDAASNVFSLLKNYPDLEIWQLEQAALDWLKDVPDYPNAIQFWFGPGKSGEPPWMRGVRALKSRDGV